MPLALCQLLKIAPNYFPRDDACKITYSQFGEDVIVYHLLEERNRKEPYRGFFVDAGSFHPRFFSNTKILSMLGWRGINIDANPNHLPSFMKERPNDINLCCGIGPKNGELPFYKFGAVSTFSPEEAKKIEKKFGQKVHESIVQIRTLNSILDEHLPENKKIDYMNIDVEGLDGDVVLGLDFSKYRPIIFTIEFNTLNKNAPIENPTVKFMIENNYSLYSITGVNCIFVDNEVVPSYM